VIIGAVYISKRRGIAMGDDEGSEGTATRSADPAVVSSP
jgi:K(+)-stimulated pyrophosphate-energized sodium pump